MIYDIKQENDFICIAGLLTNNRREGAIKI